MKIYKDTCAPSKSWSIKLRTRHNGDECIACPVISVVDSDTGRVITNLIEFRDDGEVRVKKDVSQYLERSGYDPGEHGNVFNASGTIKIKYDKRE